MRTSNVGLSLLVYAVLAILVVPVFPHFQSPNELSRWFVAKAIVEEGTVEVTKQAEGYWNEDLSEREGRLYSNKAPGGTLAGLPAYAAARVFTSNMRVTLTAMRLFAATIPAIALALVLAFSLRRYGASEERIGVAVIALLFGTPLFAYGLLLFSHALAAFCLFTAWYLLFIRRSHDVFAGALLGLAVLSEYPCAVPAAILFFCARRWKASLGALPFALTLGGYNQLAFGSPFSLSSGHERAEEFRALASSGVFGIGFPSLKTFLQLLLDPSKGLLLFSPVLVLAVLAVPKAYRRLERWTFISLVAVPVALLLLYSGYPNWHGGWTVGVRYLVPALPFLAFLLGLRQEEASADSVVARRAATPRSQSRRRPRPQPRNAQSTAQVPRPRPRGIEPVLLGWSIVAVIVTTLVFPFVPQDIPVPWAAFAIPLLRRGLVAPNLLHWIARPLAIVIPFALAFGIALVVIKRRVALLAGMSLALAMGALTPAPLVRIQRAFIEEVHFERRGAIARETPAGMQVSPAFLARAAEQKNLPPPSWPF